MGRAINLPCRTEPAIQVSVGRNGPAAGDDDSTGSFSYVPVVKETLTPRPMDARVAIGHVHLKVADLNRALNFYCGILGFELTQRLGTSAAFISAGGYHHHIGLNTWESAGGSPPPKHSTGLYHLAILYPTRALLADAVRRVLDAGIEMDGAADHGVSEAIYLRDPDANGVELYWDRPQAEWPRTSDGQLAMFTHPLDLAILLKETPALQTGKNCRKLFPVASRL
jgi:catechol 2,3-dioxygenase